LNSINFGTLIPLVIGILAGGLGSALIVIAWQKKRSIPITDSWLPAQGNILSSEVKEHSAVNPGSNSQTVFSPMVRYQYTCAGRSFSGFRLTFNPVDYTRSQAEQIANRFSPGNQATIYYDPLHPEEAVLERSTNNYNLIFTSGLVLFALGLGSFCMTLLVFWTEKAVR
jgi:hypothetical protein